MTTSSEPPASSHPTSSADPSSDRPATTSSSRPPGLSPISAPAPAPSRSPSPASSSGTTRRPSSGRGKYLLLVDRESGEAHEVVLDPHPSDPSSSAAPLHALLLGSDGGGGEGSVGVLGDRAGGGQGEEDELPPSYESVVCAGTRRGDGARARRASHDRAPSSSSPGPGGWALNAEPSSSTGQAASSVRRPSAMTAASGERSVTTTPSAADGDGRRQGRSSSTNTASEELIITPDGDVIEVVRRREGSRPSRRVSGASVRSLGDAAGGGAGVTVEQLGRVRGFALSRSRSMGGSSNRRPASLSDLVPAAPRSIDSLLAGSGPTEADGPREYELDSSSRPLPPSSAHLRSPSSRRRRRCTSWSMSAYLAPATSRQSWLSLCHLVVINFPLALFGWVLLFVGTLAGTGLLVTLPIGAILWLLTLYMSRSLARLELATLSYFHGSLPSRPTSPPPPPPALRPVFTRPRRSSSRRAVVGREEGGVSDVGSGGGGGGGETEPLLGGRAAREGEEEQSFLSKCYEMVTDDYSYRTLFYHLLIKPALTLPLSILLVLVVAVTFPLVFTIPLGMRFVREAGRMTRDVGWEFLR